MGADNITCNPGSGGATLRTLLDTGGTVEWPASVAAYVTGGVPGGWTLQPVDLAHGLPVQVLGTVPVSAAALPLPAGAASAANQSTEIAALDGIEAALGGTLTISGSVSVSNFPATQPVSIAASVAVTGTFWQATQPVSPVAAATGGASISRTLSAVSTNATSIKGSAATLYSVRATNTNPTNARYVKVYNKATAPTVGTDTPVDTIAVPAAASASQPSVVVWSGPAVGVALSLGLGVAITGGLADSDTTAVGLDDVILTVVYE